MANNNFITNTSVFTPFTYEEIVAPLLQQTQAEIELEDKYAELGQNAGAIGSQLNPENDKQAFAMYQRYMRELERQAGDLSRRGLDNSSRANLMNLFKRYGSDIVPIQTALTNRAAEVKRFNELLDKDPTRLYNFNPSITSIDKYVSNPTLAFESRSGALLAQEVANQVAPIAKVLRSAKNYGSLDNYTKLWLEERGLTPEEIQYAISHPNDPGMLQSIVEKVVKSSGIDNWGDKQTSMMARYYAQQGLWQGIGQDNIHSYEDYGSKMALQNYYATQREMNSLRLRAALSGNGRQEEQNRRGSAWRVFRSTSPGDSKNVKTRGDQQAFNDMYNGNIPLDMDLLEKIAKDNGIDINTVIDSDGNFLQSGYQAMNEAFGKSAMLNTEFELNLTDYSKVANLINRALNAKLSSGQEANIREYKNGRISDKKAKIKDVLEYTNNDMSLVLDPINGYFLVGRNKDGDIKRFYMDPDLLSGNRLETREMGEQELQSYLEMARQQYVSYVNSGDFESAGQAIELLGDNLYWTFNTSLKIQGNTTNDIN